MRAPLVHTHGLENRLAVDVQSVGALRAGARQQSPETLRQLAQQFEALLVQQMLKTMRQAMPKDAGFNGQATQLFRGMHDEQLAQQVTGNGGFGLADALLRQLMRNINHTDTAHPVASPARITPTRAGTSFTAAYPVKERL